MPRKLLITLWRYLEAGVVPAGTADLARILETALSVCERGLKIAEQP
jgi:hypothetical protein